MIIDPRTYHAFQNKRICVVFYVNRSPKFYFPDLVLQPRIFQCLFRTVSPELHYPALNLGTHLSKLNIYDRNKYSISNRINNIYIILINFESLSRPTVRSKMLTQFTPTSRYCRFFCVHAFDVHILPAFDLLPEATHTYILFLFILQECIRFSIFSLSAHSSDTSKRGQHPGFQWLTFINVQCIKTALILFDFNKHRLPVHLLKTVPQSITPVPSDTRNQSIVHRLGRLTP